MTLPEFLALKVGDRIANPMSNSAGTVTALVLDRRKQQEGVWIEWDGTSPDTARSFTTQTTAWMHWTNVLSDDIPTTEESRKLEGLDP